MLRFDPQTAREKVPVIVVSGIDGRAKTTSIQDILSADGMRWAVISNEENGPEFKAATTERVVGQMVPHAIGCLCCVTRSGLVSSLRRLYAMRSQGQICFDKVIIETLPDFDPAPVIQTLLNNALVTEYFRLDSVVTVLAASGFSAISQSTHGVKQLALSDKIIVEPSTCDDNDLSRRLGHLNPAADVLRSDRNDLSNAVMGAGLEARLLRGDVEGWLGRLQYAKSDALELGLHGFAVEFDEPLDWDAFHAWLNAGTQTNGDIMFRTKAAIRIAGLDGPVLINGAQHVYQPPQILSDFSIETSTLMMITDDLDKSAVQQSLSNDLPQFARINAARAERALLAAIDPSIPL